MSSAEPLLQIRPFQSLDDYRGMIDYFHDSSDELLLGMGVERSRLPAREQWLEQAWTDHHLPEDDPQRNRFFVAWLHDGTTVGHSSINQIRWGESACGHLHLWRTDLRRGGIGTWFFRQSVSLYFDRFSLETLYVEPKADNPPPNRVVTKLGFTFVKRYRTVPGPYNFEQDINRYEMRRTAWDLLVKPGQPRDAASPA